MLKNFSLTPSAYFLVAHGSRASQPQIALERLSYLVQEQLDFASLSVRSRDKSHGTLSTTALKSPLPWVGFGTLEFSALPLHQQLIQFAQEARARGLKQVKILPLFLSAGVHVTEDLPQEVTLTREQLQKTAPQLEVSFVMQPYLGSHPQITTLLAEKFKSHPHSGKILMAHGSRKAGGNTPLEKIAQALNVVNSYWAVPPSLETQVETLIAQGADTITIVPYFLFAGGITEAIATQAQQLQKQYPHVKFDLETPLGTTPALARLLTQP